MMGFRDPNADETYWAEYWDEFLTENGVSEYVKARYQDGGNLRNCYDTSESWSLAVAGLTEQDVAAAVLPRPRDIDC